MRYRKLGVLVLPTLVVASLATVGRDQSGGLSLGIVNDALADIVVTKARIGCLDIQTDGNLTGLVGQACNHRMSCAYKAPTEAQYHAAGVQARTRSFCSQGMEVTYQCGDGHNRTVSVAGDAWNHDPAQLHCDPAPVTNPATLPFGQAPITVTKARIGCLDLQHDGNLTPVVARDCNGRPECTYKAPTPDAYARLGVHAATRTFCTQAMEITYRCGNQGDAKTITVAGDAWNNPPARLVCDGGTVATNIETVSGLPDERCDSDFPRKYFLAPADMLDWTPLEADTLPIENHPPPPATRAMYNVTSGRPGSPGSTLGANEGRLTEYLRKVAARHDATAALCEAAKAYAGNSAGGIAGVRPTGVAHGNAMADLAVTGRHSFARFRTDNPTLDSMKRACGGVDDAHLNRALDRAYSVANAVRVRGTAEQPTAARRALGWIAVSGEDDKPYRPVNVPSAHFPQFGVDVNVHGLAGSLSTIHTRYMIAHARPPAFRQGPALAHGGAREVVGDVEPAIAPDANVIVFIHGMDSRVEEALNLTKAMHDLAQQPGGKNWTIISLDMPTSGYADSIDHNVLGPAGNVTCHHTPLVDFLESYIVKFVDAVDAQVGGHLKPRIRAVVGGSLGGNMALRLGRRAALGTQPAAPWLHNVVPWSPASIWPPMTNRGGVTAGCDSGWDVKNDIAIGWPRGMAEVNERPNDRRNSFYGGFDYAPPGQRPQAQYWWRDDWSCKAANVMGGRVDRQETYDALFRRYHWRLGAEQLAFSHRQNRGADATRGALADPLFLYNTTRTLLIAGALDTGGDLGSWTNRTAPLMRNTPGMFRFLAHTGHSLDDERPGWVAKEIVNFLAGDPHAP